MHVAWGTMKQRCTNSCHPRWKDYGGRGITVCNRWLLSFEAFRDDMIGGWKPGLWLDRADNDRGYEPGNCRWVTPTESARNRRSHGPQPKLSNPNRELKLKLTEADANDIRALEGEYTQRELAVMYGVSQMMIYNIFTRQTLEAYLKHCQKSGVLTFTTATCP